MKTLTPWSNNDIKPPAGWSPTTKAPVLFTPAAAKQPTQYTAATKQLDGWGPSQHSPQDYFFDDAIVTFDDPRYDFDFMVNNNTDNQRLVTRWAAA